MNTEKIKKIIEKNIGREIVVETVNHSTVFDYYNKRIVKISGKLIEFRNDSGELEAGFECEHKNIKINYGFNNIYKIYELVEIEDE